MSQNVTQIYALGGIEEIGKNTYAVETKETLLLIDVGIKFANTKLPGFDSLIANIKPVIENENKLAAIIITHGHEDHIGAIPYLLKNIKVKKIYASRLSKELIIKKLTEHKLTIPEFIEIDEYETYYENDIEIEFFRVCHSIPDSYGVAFNTSDGRIVSTGDFRFDFSTFGNETNIGRLMEISNKGVDLLLCESTSAEVPGFSDSERYIIDNIEYYLKNAPGRIFMSTFASNLSRIEQTLLIAKKLNKKILILGRSMDANIKISRKIGYLKMSDIDFIQSKDIGNYADNELFIVLTGSQGEEQAALSSIINGRHARISFKPTDTVLLSSNPIPGNFYQVQKMINELYLQGVNVIENKPSKKIHASGHATKSELQLMIKSINPVYLLPIHGEFKMLNVLKHVAIETGFNGDNVLIAKNGQKIILFNHKAEITNEFVDAEPIYINNGELTYNSSELLNTRKNLATDGIIQVIIKYSQEKNIVYSVTVSTRGCFYAKDNIPFVAKTNALLKDFINKFIDNKQLNKELIANETEQFLKGFIWKTKRKSPIIFIDMINFDDLISLKDNKEFITIPEDKIEEVETDEFDESVI